MEIDWLNIVAFLYLVGFVLTGIIIIVMRQVSKAYQMIFLIAFSAIWPVVWLWATFYPKRIKE